MKEELLEDFKNKKNNFDAFKDRMINLLRDLIQVEGITPHQITGRTKDLISLSKKIEKKGDKYSNLNDITDIVGLRIITYLESEVDPIASIIIREFEQDKENSIDKRILKNDQFGYKSLHVVISLKDKRLELPEYSNYKYIKCEIQIRSILQHAWAEIEHDLGYKGTDIPDEYKRSFSRVAALLETADIEFVNLKIALKTYENNVSALIESGEEEVDLNKASINSFIKNNDVIFKVKEIIEGQSGHPLQPENNYDLVISILKSFGIDTIQSLKSTLDDNKKGYLDFVTEFVNTRNLHKPLSSTVLLMYLGHYLALKSDDKERLEKYLISFSPQRDDSLATSFLNIFKASKKRK